ncbi:ATP-dependent Clp protease ATP-binding subunit ClpA [Filimonas lacunae]|uniref:ATP-dependent Clp protease ATP-binding subunit ClpA n=1 Tax=Filimonas lacunae TaxID=477680 RepID=A0A173MS14_9BACT|nr:ATP-dependent Clp protease ATP-binding subunit [Filimonas lacunae]BAV10181.1 ClpB protein [Filimonas lacunae]SIT18542.1 ATP-dependent Clp protease ATP-binding subunit ClpA [Filimonas lacunae]
MIANTVNDIALDANVEKAIDIAQAIAKENRHGSFSAAHLLKGLLHKEVLLEPFLLSVDADVYYLADWAEVRIEEYPKSGHFNGTIIAAEDIAVLLDEADNIRLMLNKDHLEPLHVLIALSTPGVSFSYEQLKTFPLQRAVLMERAGALNSKQQLLQPAQATVAKNGTEVQAITRYCIDKTLLAAEGKLDPIVGREQEVRMMAEILSRRSKPNVLLIGEPGVGKSALVDGFTLAIKSGEVPQFLQQAKVFELDNGALAAGASYKGEIEERLKQIVKEIKQFEKAILFIDEMHVLMDRQGAFAGAANLLKPELARGAVTIIGATTLDEYRKYIEKDEAFARRFELLEVEEPDAATAYRMVKTVLPLYEEHHGITVPDETVKESVRLAKRYIKDRKLPDAAIDLIDRSMAALKLLSDTGSTFLQHFKNAYETVSQEEAEMDAYLWHYRQLKSSTSAIVWSLLEEDFQPEEVKELDEWKRLLSGIYDKLAAIVATNRTSLDKHDVASIVADKTGIPLGKVQAQEKERLLNMQAIIKERVVGQDHAVQVISEAVLESRSGLGKAGQPIGSFFFLGPTGTGKTELAKALAEFLFQDASSIIRFDMSEFKEEHAAALLYGAPPGYVGYEEGGLLVNKIRQQPYAVVLFDEIEKAHPSVFDLFLQLMDEGKLHDKLGKEGDFSNALVLFTSNIGSQYVVDSFNEGRVPDNASLMNIMSKHFRPEFLGRLTEIVPFAPMKQAVVNRILDIQLKDVHLALEKQHIKLVLRPAAHNQLAVMGYTPEYGARPLGGVIRSQIRRPLSKKIISNELLAGRLAILDYSEREGFRWEIKNEL